MQKCIYFYGFYFNKIGIIFISFLNFAYLFLVVLEITGIFFFWGGGGGGGSDNMNIYLGKGI